MATALGPTQPYSYPSSATRYWTFERAFFPGWTIDLLFTDSTNRSISCSFCSEKYSSRELEDHLLRCGNKTEQCPNCHKFIRRAIFAYHYENQCSDIPEEEPTQKKSDSSTVVNCEFCAQRYASKDYHFHQVNISLFYSP